ncbi:hypothetical protein Nepgr_002015 [Nepenthes gracilis]|uniref:VQ domain-containing protein n=1 Tax=Nepenthes gracilis TaxID=150966 RepID=A0AAD3P5I8_NEPGR|nr:hypothetical protein Nepgr_002015 [Nepenthes gracilis]
MDKSCQSSGEASASAASISSVSSSSSGSSRDQYLRHLHKMSHKISKPTIIRKPFDPPQPDQRPRQPPSQPPQSLQQLQQPQPQNQPPVYNINKNDFRVVVQKLTGSPAHERISTPPPIHAPKPPSSRLQRIRPPPLAQISSRPPPVLNYAVLPQNAPAVSASAGGGGGNPFFRQVAPLSPLPPLPSCHAAAESPISAYMRYLHSSIDSDPKRISGIPQFSPLISPKFNDPAVLHLMTSQQHQQPLIPPPTAAAAQFGVPPPSSPLPFGCFPSPKSPCPLLSPNLLFSPTGTGQFGFPQFPISPRVPAVPSPK